MVEEKRKYKRFDIPLDVKINASKEGDIYHTGITKNFSRSGLCLESMDFAPGSGEVIDLNIKAPFNNAVASAVGVVAWCRRSEDKYVMGVKLMVMDREAKSNILGHAYDQWMEKMRSSSPVDHDMNLES